MKDNGWIKNLLQLVEELLESPGMGPEERVKLAKIKAILIAALNETQTTIMRKIILDCFEGLAIDFMKDNVREILERIQFSTKDIYELIHEIFDKTGLLG